MDWRPALISSNDRPDQVKPNPWGSVRLASASISSIACPELKRRAAVDLSGPEQVVVADDLGRRSLAHTYDVGERHHGATVRPGVVLPQALWIGSKCLVGLHVHAIRAI